MRRSLLVSVLVHLAVLLAAAGWWSGLGPETGKAVPVRLRTVSPGAPGKEPLPAAGQGRISPADPARPPAPARDAAARESPAPVLPAAGPQDPGPPEPLLPGPSGAEFPGTGDTLGFPESPEFPGAQPPSFPESPAALEDFPPPAYPREARRRGWEGAVVVLVEVDGGGGPGRMTVTRSSGHPVLDEAALAALGKARYRPASRGGAAVPGTVSATVRFRLE